MTKSLLLASASLVMLGFATEAKAFDEVNWTWNETVDSTVNFDVTATSNLVPTGLVKVEKIQMNIGDVEAKSYVSGIDNNAPGAVEGDTATVSIDETFNFTTPTDDSGDPSTIVPTAAIEGENGQLSGEIVNGTIDEGADVLNETVHVFGDVEVDVSDLELGGIKDGVDLPSVESAATAVANNQSISSTVSTELHDAQYNFGGFGELYRGEGELYAYDGFLGTEDQEDAEGGNSHTDILELGVLSAALGIITPGEVSAKSKVSDINDASVDSSATAVANNMTVDLNAATPGDALLIADITQFNYADVYAKSSVRDVTVDGYNNLAALDGALVKSVATAVGNNVDITVNSVGVSTGE